MHSLLNTIGLLCLMVGSTSFVLWLLLTVRAKIRGARLPKKTLYTFLISSAIFCTIFMYVQYFFTFEAIAREDMQEGVVRLSPNKQMTASVFYEPYGGAAGGVNVWVEVQDNHAAEPRIIYYADAKQNVQINWVDDETISIANAGGGEERNAVLHVKKDIYHENGLACQSLLLKNTYEQCYSHPLKKISE